LKKLAEFFFLLLEGFGFEHFHLHVLNFFRARQREKVLRHRELGTDDPFT
jgi:hypothetical protein